MELVFLMSTLIAKLIYTGNVQIVTLGMPVQKRLSTGSGVVSVILKADPLKEPGYNSVYWGGI